MGSTTRLVVSAAALLFAACVVVVPGTVAGNGSPNREAREVKGFTGVENRTSLPVSIEEDRYFSVVSKIDSNLQDYLSFEVHDGVLVIDLQSASGIHPTGSPVVEIRMPDFYEATAAGSGRMEIAGVTGGRDLVLRSVGSGGLDFTGTAHSLDADCRGSGGMTLTGSVGVLSAQVTGSGSIDAVELDATSADLWTSGSGSIAASLGGGWLKARVYGSGSIDWWGAADVLLLEDFGSGRVRHHAP